jgi:hypothetical protein
MNKNYNFAEDLYGYESWYLKGGVYRMNVFEYRMLRGMLGPRMCKITEVWKR